LTISIDRLLLNSKDKCILNLLSLTLPAKGMVLLCGQSGTGKSLLLKSILGLIKGDQWDSQINIRIDNGNRGQIRSQTPSIGYIPQDIRQSFDQNKSIAYHISEAMLGQELSKSDLHKSLLDFDLPLEILQRYPHQCSGGQLQRILVLMADLHKPKVILADEAISALDPDNEATILQYLKNQVEHRNCLVIAVSHRFDLEFYDQILYLKNGEIIINKHIADLTSVEKEMLFPSISFTTTNKQKESKLLLRLTEVILPYQPAPQKIINLDFMEGLSYGIYGKSGSGKTTMLKCMSGLLPFEKGKSDWTIKDPRIQMVFQHPSTGFNPKRTIKAYFGEYNQIFKKNYEISISKLMLEMNLDHVLLDRLPSQLSGGELQRISIIRALASKPNMVLFDEAFASIDLENASNIQSILDKFQKEHAITYVFVSHDSEFLKSVSKDLIII
jgi:peptide/nickel transport system ATP-binding protein